MATTYTLISSVTVGSGGAANMEFTSIPATYTDLLLKVSARGTAATGTDTIDIRFNASSTGYSVKRLYGQASSNEVGSDSTTTSGYLTIGFSNSDSQTANTFGSLEMYVPNYTSSNNKSVSTDSTPETNATTTYRGFYAGLWSNSAAINQITIYTNSTNFAQYSTAYLYGISNA